MADAALVTDTHALVYWTARSQRLSKRALRHFEACERQEAILYVPAAVIWETALLARAGRLGEDRPIRTYFNDLFSNPAYQPLDLTPEQVYLAAENFPAGDPFDALIAAAAMSLDLPLLTRDARLQASPEIRTVW
ncbi:MAG TPA: type II toxin-antitoxin system VapC family toxin [Thermoanaerobaculia bacterium]|nr:type II toxin-antitoxin system VapC family toxin [Thermoanaerobaculia bacterium]HQR66043.1 type II toxin-antitoxin system VapC family toxin [Thermoanaerobaculia bacterium]